MLYKKESGVCGREEGGERNELDMRDVRATNWRWPANRTPITHAKARSFFLSLLAVSPEIPKPTSSTGSGRGGRKGNKGEYIFYSFFRAYRLSSQTNSWANEGLEHLACVRRYAMF